VVRNYVAEMGNNLWSTKFLAFAKLDATRRKECEKVYERKHVYLRRRCSSCRTCVSARKRT
jgi:hypothetical protein